MLYILKLTADFWLSVITYNLLPDVSVAYKLS